MDENKYNFSIKFEKQQPSINAETYVQSLISLSTIIREVNYQTGNGPAVAVNVLAQEPGSFKVVLELAEVIKNNQALIVGGAVFLSGIVTIVVGVIQLKKWSSKSDDSKTEINGDQVNIKDTNGDVIFQTNNITYNIYKNNQAVNDAVSAQFQAVTNDEEMEAITIQSDDDTVTLKRDDFPTLSQKRLIEVEDTEEATVAAQLTISKLVLDNKDRKWEFVYQGSKVGAKIDDEDFWQKILAGEVSFANGDVLVADLKIIREYDATIGTYLNKDYCVMNVRQHLPRTRHRQTSMDDLTDS
jgi:hypothetical protein